jgi:AraC family transcriptional activator of pobA
MPRKVNIDTILQFHKLAGLSQPPQGLLSVVKLGDLKWKPVNERTTIIRDFYIIAWKKGDTQFRYGQQDMNFKGGSLHFMAPKQVITIDTPVKEVPNDGWLLLIHRDFLWNTSLAKKIRQYQYFKYEFNQVLPLNTDEQKTIISIFEQIQQEQHLIKGAHTKNVIMAQIELLLAYAERYYQTRHSGLGEKQANNILAELEVQIEEYLQRPDLILSGIPTIKYLSDMVHVSPSYLSRLIQSLTGHSTQHFLHDKLITLAKEKLSTTSFSISEIAYQLGFKTPQSFSRLFRAKTNQTPTDFRDAF